MIPVAIAAGILSMIVAAMFGDVIVDLIVNTFWDDYDHD